MTRQLLVAALLSWSVPAVRAGELKIAPVDIVLTGPKATQQLLVLDHTALNVVGDVSRQAKFSSSAPNIAAVDADGVVRALGDGEATITAVVAEGQASTRVKVEKTAADFDWSFRNHVIPVLTKLGCNSGACHGALAGKGGFKLSLRGYAPSDDHFVLTRQANGRRINPLEPARSLMLMKPSLALTHGGGLKLEVNSPEYKLVADWIVSGAPGPSKSDPAIQKLEVFPPDAVLKPKDQLQLVARAWYSDGRAEDVTRWARFASTEDLIAGVDDAGSVKVSGYGEAAITVSFSNLVATTRISAPFDNALDAKVFAGSPRHNFIDNLVLKKLEALRIPPSPQCTDDEFIRRAYLDAAGMLPTPEEVEAFLKDARPDRRARLIDSLLARPEFVDYWAYKWSDLLLISSRKLSAPAMRSFYSFVRQSVADNKPWDQFARDILTASGSNLHNGAGNFFVLHKEITDLTESTAITFMGTSITCARCHNHPLEKWTQDQYWGMANLFSQVAIKNGERAGEITVQSLGAGDVLHPRRGVPVPPAPLDGKAAADSADRRGYFTSWLTAPDNPFFAKAVVNRVWRNFMGRGLVEAEDDLRQTNPPSNEELFDALAKDFIAHGYDVKKLARTIMNAAAYQRSSVSLAGNKADDRFYSRYLVRRLPAEVVLDAYSSVTKVPTAFTKVNVGTSGGEAGTGDYPLGTRALQLPDTQLISQFLDAFGRPERGQTCSCERQTESSVTQALHLNNGQTLNDKLRDKKSRIEEWLKEKIADEEAIRRVFLLALCRAPTAEERTRFLNIMAEGAGGADAARREILEDLFWAVLTGREFLFNR
ncbi:MAG: DUF1553 domain-containing protein [Gemmataceae bacterium]|nr:DUF1553 domain-containing protein [Gemmataceae bacterium]MCI0742916.1 DUF1553 domain-containing protein [Gemmataceae bacterium]